MLDQIIPYLLLEFCFCDGVSDWRRYSVILFSIPAKVMDGKVMNENDKQKVSNLPVQWFLGLHPGSRSCCVKYMMKETCSESNAEWIANLSKFLDAAFCNKKLLRLNLYTDYSLTQMINREFCKIFFNNSFTS